MRVDLWRPPGAGGCYCCCSQGIPAHRERGEQGHRGAAAQGGAPTAPGRPLLLLTEGHRAEHGRLDTLVGRKGFSIAAVGAGGWRLQTETHGGGLGAGGGSAAQRLGGGGQIPEATGGAEEGVWGV